MHEQDVISIKGNKDQLRMLVDERADWTIILSALHAHLDQAGSFFAGAQLTIEVGERHLSQAQLVEVLELMQRHGLRPDTLAASTRESRSIARALGLTSRPMPQPTPTPAATPAETESTLVCRTLHSGQVLRHHRHVTLIGDVNAGAQIIAGGCVVVWGKLRGLVHAGALGDEAAMVCALDLRPTQLRIAHLIARTPDDMSSHLPEVARIEHDHIVVESWEVYKLRL